MQSLKLFFRFVCLLALVTFPLILMGGVIYGSNGVFIGLILGCILVLLIAFISEKIIIQTYEAHINIPFGLSRSLDLVLQSASIPRPRLLIYADPFPNIIVVRSMMGAGTILLSQGLVSLLNDAELKEVLKMALVRLQQSTLVFQSLSSVFALGALSLIPRSWSRLVFVGQMPSDSEKPDLGPFFTLVFLVLYPLVRFFVTAGNIPLNGQAKTQLEHSSAYLVQKLGGLIPLFGDKKNYGTLSLYVIPEFLLRP